MSLKNGDRSLKNVSKGVLLELSILKKKKNLSGDEIISLSNALQF